MIDNYYDNAVAFKQQYKALKRSCLNVRWKDSVVEYEAYGLINTLTLCDECKVGEHKVLPYQMFKIYEPKERIVLASRLPDRQFQKALCEAGLYQDITEHFIRDNVACVKGRGTDDAIKRLKTHLHRYYRIHGCDGWVLRCDIKHYFPETKHSVAKAAVHKYVSDPRAAAVVYDVIDSFPGDKGMGLGSELSQLVQLLVLNELDHYIKERLRIKYYIRYMDDFVLIHADKEYLQQCRQAIENMLRSIGLQLNHKTSLHPLKQGIKFLQWRYILTDTGRVLMLANPKKVSKAKRRLRKLWQKECRGDVPNGTTHVSYTCIMANLRKGNTFAYQQRLKQYYIKLTNGGGNNATSIS